MADEPREYTKEEVRERFLDHVRTMVRYWADPQTAYGQDCVYRLSGLAFSILVALDGDADGVPGFIVAPSTHPEDKAYFQAEGQNWYPENHDSGVKCDIAGSLHEHFYKEPARG